MIIQTVAKTLNNLPAEVVLELVPPEPILDDSKSANQQPVLATLDVNPQDPEGGYNYLSVPAGNANFGGLDVRQGDIVRYFVKYDPESIEHGGGGEATYLEIPVRRLDTNNPNNALILDVPLSGAMPEPTRIEIWRFSDRRMREIQLRLDKYVRRRDPAIAWEPSPDETALLLLVDRANQWFRNLTDDRSEWKSTNLVATLPKGVREAKTIAPQISDAALRDGQFDLAQVRSLQEAVWLRDISTWAKGEAYEKLDIAKALFDWTVRNIQLDDSDQPGIVHQPWQALMYGHGSAAHRAWVFAELCRQQQIDVVILTLGVVSANKWWAAVNVDGQLYLFDLRLGLPITSDQEKVATLDEVTANPELLRAFDLDGANPYWIAADDLNNLKAAIVASSLQLSRRAAALQAVLQGEDFVVLAANVDKLAESFKNVEHLETFDLWPFPYEEHIAEITVRRPQRIQAAQRFLVFAQLPKLWKARTLHFQGTKPIPVSQQNDPLAQPRRGHQEAVALYQSPEVRVRDEILERVEPLERVILGTAKADASYWLGLLSYDLGKYEVADDWLRTRTLEAFPSGPWTAGARYNLARTLIKLGKIEEALPLLEADESPQWHGNRLLARQLKAQLDAGKADLDAEAAASSEE
jgi:tetratricopeptide (TPR) repeat protein